MGTLFVYDYYFICDLGVDQGGHLTEFPVLAYSGFRAMHIEVTIHVDVLFQDW